jgi:hypothetical protein
MPQDRISIWKYETAPMELRRLHNGQPPDWMALVPRFLYDIDLVREMETRGGKGWMAHYRAKDGAIVLVGSREMSQILVALTHAKAAGSST